jgi:hypothetical protein
VSLSAPARWFRALLYALVVAAGIDTAVVAGETSPGARLYLDGRLPSGEPLRGLRAAGEPLEGPAAACANCHRRSGLGGYEGAMMIPPIIGRYLFRDRQTNLHDLDLPHLQGFTPNLDAYTEESLATAIRTGRARDGHQLGYLMPRYALDDSAISMLTDYLRSLTARPDPGVSATHIQLATIVTPDASPAARDGMLGVLQRFISVHNQSITVTGAKPVAGQELQYRVQRRWNLRVWRLAGPPETWQRQLEVHLAAEPVFAVIAGVGGRTWEPVHRFCNAAHVPCLLPNVDLPVDAEQDYYSVYWSRGVLLEGALIAGVLRAAAATNQPSRRVMQLYRADDIGIAGAESLVSELGTAGVDVVRRPIDGAAGPALANAIAGLRAGDRLVLWLRPPDLAALPAAAPVGVETYVSGLLGGLEQAPLPPAWRVGAHLTYPYDLPQLRRARMNFPLAWLRSQQLALIDERVQTNTLLACEVLAETLEHMLDGVVRDFLLERVEAMIGRHVANGYFPRLGLGTGQRFASKGGYLVRFAAAKGTALQAEGDWTVP